MPGVSKRSVLLVSALMGAYLFILLGHATAGPPPIGERSTGYWFERLDPPQIIERFGDNPARLWAYNVLSSVMSIPFSEPRGGIWSTTQALVRNRLELRDLIRIVSALFATGLIAAYVVDRLRSGVRRPATMADRHVVIFGAVLVANAMVAFVYTKDEIISTAGAFYALPVFGAAVHFLRRWPERRRSWGATAALCLLFLVGSAAWATRAAGVHHVLRTTAFVHRNDWTRIERLWRRDGNWERYADSEALIRQIREESILMPVVNPYFMPRWMDRVFDTN